MTRRVGVVKVEADVQHPTCYLLDLGPELLSQLAESLGQIPWVRQLGSILLEPM
jgi:hypothetical protein